MLWISFIFLFIVTSVLMVGINFMSAQFPLYGEMVKPTFYVVTAIFVWTNLLKRKS